MMILKTCSYGPLDFLGKPQKQSFPKWLPSVPDEHEFFICGAIFTSKRSILTNLGMGIPFLTFTVTFNILLVMN